MNDPLADVRERLLTGRWFDHELTDLEIEHVKSMEADIERLLADADAMLAVVRAVKELAMVRAASGLQASDITEERVEEVWEEYLEPILMEPYAALPEHLRGNTDG